MSKWLTLKPEDGTLRSKDTVMLAQHNFQQTSGKGVHLNYAGASLYTAPPPPEKKECFFPFKLLKMETKVSLCRLSLLANPSSFACASKMVLQKELIPEMANPLKPTARTRKEMATARVWEKPTTSSRVASIPKPAINTCKNHFRSRSFRISITIVLVFNYWIYTKQNQEKPNGLSLLSRTSAVHQFPHIRGRHDFSAA